MSVRSSDLVRHFQTNDEHARGLINGWIQLQDAITKLLEELGSDRTDALIELAVAYLPTLSAQDLADAERLTGYRGFTRRNPLQAMDRERDVLNRTVARIAVDDRYLRRHILVGLGGELTSAVEEAEQMLEPWEKECAPFEAQPGWKELLHTGYDTPQFSLSFFEPRYWTLWKQGDEACTALGMDDFGDDVLPAFHAADRQRRVWKNEVREAKERVNEVHELTRAKDEAEARIPQLPTLFLAACHKQMAAYFERAELGLLEEWLKNDSAPEEPDRAVLHALRKGAAATAKVHLLRELSQGNKASIQELRARQAKFRRKVVKYGRSKYAYQSFPETAMDQGFRSKLNKYKKRPIKLGALARRIAEYESYEGYDLSDNAEELWFVEMTGKRPPTQLPKTRRWYDRHPEEAPTRDYVETDRRSLVEAAVAGLTDDSMGYLS